ncbi:MAG: 50S ribosomal protein L17 [Lentisphaerae bacterium]|nr:50S ribosomal protein L17 [Lentisphaerota bacterium]
MRHRVHTFKVGRTGAHRRAMLANMVCSLIEHGQITTSLVKAREARRVAEKMVTLGKKGDLHHRRLAISTLRKPDMVAKLFAEIAPAYAGRQGGYTSIIKLGKRRGDACEMCILKFVAAAAPAAEEAKAE